MTAAGTDVLTEQLTLKYTDLTIDGQGGLLGTDRVGRAGGVGR